MREIKGVGGVQTEEKDNWKESAKAAVKKPNPMKVTAKAEMVMTVQLQKKEKSKRRESRVEGKGREVDMNLPEDINDPKGEERRVLGHVLRVVIRHWSNFIRFFEL